MNAVQVRLERAGETESVHEVHAAVLAGGELETWGTADVTPFWRSAMKPFQALPFVRDGVLDDLGLADRELAVACASHHGMPEHVEAVGRILGAAGIDASALACGPHRPLDEGAARALDERGRLPERIHNNCSGKHAAMLASAIAAGVPTEGYQGLGHPIQQRIRRVLEEWLDLDVDALVWGVDGCGVPTPRLPLPEIAAAYDRFVRSREPAVVAVATAMRANPTMVSGPTALSAAVMSATAGRVLAKEGAEGVFCAGDPVRGWAAAFKVRDGAMRALGPSVVHVLGRFGALDDEEVGRLAAFAEVRVTNTRDEAVAALVAGAT
ncbi:MAG: asparaginase [Gemmatimonadota bacterium]|nr:asparaginase [Gemmatimonadota bacterium]